ncbi:MAG: nitronate monooxygenase [Acidimicrobiales bacterium]
MARISNVFTERLGIDVPILGFAHDTQVAAAITQAGGLGVYGIAHDEPSDLPAKLEALRTQSGTAPTAVDMIIPAGMPENVTLDQVQASLPEEHKQFLDDIVRRYEVPPATRKSFFNSTLRTPDYFEGQLDALLDSDVAMVAFGVGLTKEAVEALKDAGKMVGALIGSPRHVERYLDIGLDFLVAQGSEAGGHTGTIGTLVLVPEVVELAGDLPVLAAGGIAHGSQIAAALAMGAQGVWTGTIWLATREHATGDHAVSEALRAKLLAAGSGDTTVTRGSSGKPQRQINSMWAQEWNSAAAPPPLKMPYQHALVGDVMTAVEEFEIDPLLYSAAGQSIGFVREFLSVGEVMQRLVDQTVAGLDRAKGYLK